MLFHTPTLAAFMGMGATELLIILAIVVLLFGATKLPSLAKGLGESIKEFKKASKEDPNEEKKQPEAAKSDAPKGDAAKPGKN